ncbi:MAG TPA: magnesium transporter [Thermoanaerobaculia bacterium]|nr:magnesium transporter [Thermoanaerobaculia bacterium]
MTAHANPAVEAFTHRFLLDYPREAAQEIEQMEPGDAAPVLAREPLHVLTVIWDHLAPAVADPLLLALPERTAAALLAELDPGWAAAALLRMEEDQRARYLELAGPHVAEELLRLMEYSPDRAGALMDARVLAFHGKTTAGEVLSRMRAGRRHPQRAVFLVDDSQRLEAVVDVHDLALADPESPLGELGHPPGASVAAVDPRETVVELLERQWIDELPVLDAYNRLLGVIRASELMRALRESASEDLQTMVGVGKEERALSPVGFAVRKRLLWMNINLVTAFLAAAVVGMFESTIAQFTALAVLLPVVAGQSGNAGAQALAVTMRGLALREIGLRQWARLLMKELRVGMVNGAAIAVTTAAGVFVWSRNEGLALVIAISMVISMTLACVAGAMVPLALTRAGQDPAQSSSILLTTVTDVAGFLSFLGVATLLSGMLAK